jgi:hypothetical protein
LEPFWKKRLKNQKTLVGVANNEMLYYFCTPKTGKGAEIGRIAADSQVFEDHQ